MEKSKLRVSLLVTALSLLILCISLGSITYAWFTFDPTTNVTPMEGKIAKGDTNLQISEQKDGGFGKTCTLTPAHMSGTLYPVSTQTLDKFYASSAQNREGISTNFIDVTAKPAQWLIQGTLYLKCEGLGCDVYFDKATLNFGNDPQALAALRLGLRITNANNTVSGYIFRLDSMGSTDGVTSQRTVEPTGAVVVAGVDAGGLPRYADDPALSIDSYLLGGNRLLALETDEVAQVDYWLYLEGCDPECCNAVQKKDIALKLGFEGNTTETE